jgi:hypothetical protein
LSCLCSWASKCCNRWTTFGWWRRRIAMHGARLQKSNLILWFTFGFESF